MEHARVILIFMFSYCYLTFGSFMTSYGYIESYEWVIITMVLIGTTHGIIVFALRIKNRAVYSLLKVWMLRKAY